MINFIFKFPSTISVLTKKFGHILTAFFISGIVVKAHVSRLLQDNRKIAREVLTTKLDNLINGEKSVENQRKAIEFEKRKRREQKKQKLQELKEKWKEESNKTHESADDASS